MGGGGFLRIGYCLRTIGYCFPYCFLEIFVGDKALMEGDKVAMGDPPVPPLGKTLLHWDSKIFQIRAIGAIRETLLRQKPKI